MFLPNKYTKLYHRLIERARSENRVKGSGTYYESHHVVPRALGGSNSKENLVLLTAREHYIAHLLLTKMTMGSAKIKMTFALFRFGPRGRSYDIFRRAHSRLMSGKNNPFYGQKHNPTSLAKMAGDQHPMFGKRHSDAAIEKMRVSHAGKGTGPSNPMYGKTHPPEWRKAHSERLTGDRHFNYGKRGLRHVNNGQEGRIVESSLVPELLQAGWKLGQLRTVHER